MSQQAGTICVISELKGHVSLLSNCDVESNQEYGIPIDPADPKWLEILIWLSWPKLFSFQEAWGTISEHCSVFATCIRQN